MYSTAFPAHMQHSAEALAAQIAHRCEDARETRHGWLCCCPAHPDRTPSLAVAYADGKVLLRCFGGCDTGKVLDALGLRWSDLFEDAGGPATIPRPRRPSHPRTPQDTEARRQALIRLWSQSKAVTAHNAAGYYLQRRGLWIEPIPKVLRFHSHMPYYHGDDRWTHHPGLLCAVQGPDNRVVTLMRVYLDASGSKAAVPQVKKAMPVTRSMMGGAVRLAPAGPVLIVAEGIESALGAMLSSGLPGWAAVSAEGLRQVQLPDIAHLIVIASDNDINAVGQQAAHALAQRLLAEGRRVKVIAPEQVGADWADGMLDALKEDHRG